MNAVASQGLEKAGSDSAGIASDGRRCIPAPLADHDGETPLLPFMGSPEGAAIEMKVLPERLRVQ
jgi:hypothetical protein